MRLTALRFEEALVQLDTNTTNQIPIYESNKYQRRTYHVLQH